MFFVIFLWNVTPPVLTMHLIPLVLFQKSFIIWLEKLVWRTRLGYFFVVIHFVDWIDIFLFLGDSKSNFDKRLYTHMCVCHWWFQYRSLDYGIIWDFRLPHHMPAPLSFCYLLFHASLLPYAVVFSFFFISFLTSHAVLPDTQPGSRREFVRHIKCFHFRVLFQFLLF